MKIISKYKIGKEHFVKVFDNNSDSNYNRFIAVFKNENTKQPIIGTTMKSTDTKENIIDYCVSAIKRYNNDILKESL